MPELTQSDEVLESHLSAIVDAGGDGQRLDQALVLLFGDYSRSKLQHWVKAGRVTLNGAVARNKDKVHVGDLIELDAEEEQVTDALPQDIPLTIVYADADIIVINKPAGLVVHPAAGNPDGTLQNALLFYAPELDRLPRAGIVHRLDKETSGLLVVARTLKAHKSLIEQLQAREIEREYRTLVHGVMIAGGSVDAPIGRHPSQRTKMAVVINGKPAQTDYRVLERFRLHSLLQVKLHSGRTHQIRVHMAYCHYPVFGDPVYGGRLRLPPGASPELIEVLRGFKRQALHAFRLGLEHPVTGEWLSWEAPMPQDMLTLLDALREDAKLHD